MWDNYYDKVEYMQKTDELDNIGYPKFLPPRTIDVRYVSGGEHFVIGKEDTSVKFTKEYQVPFMINEGDKIDGKSVVDVKPSKDVFGNFHFCIVKVE
jgi:hypothetical protein